MSVFPACESAALEKSKVRGGGTAESGPNQAEKTRFPRNDRPYGLQCKAFQTQNVLARSAGRSLAGVRKPWQDDERQANGSRCT